MATRCPIFCWMVKIIDIYIYLCVYVVEREIEGDKVWNPYINTLENMRNFFLLFFQVFVCRIYNPRHDNDNNVAIVSQGE